MALEKPEATALDDTERPARTVEEVSRDIERLDSVTDRVRRTDRLPRWTHLRYLIRRARLFDELAASVALQEKPEMPYGVCVAVKLGRDAALREARLASARAVLAKVSRVPCSAPSALAWASLLAVAALLAMAVLP